MPPNITGLKIYTDDPLCKFKGTTVPAMRSKQLTDAVLAEYQVKDVWWHYDPPVEVWVSFKIKEVVNGVPIDVAVKIECPTLWDKARTKRHPYTPEKINWDVSMRAMYHFIYTHLNSAYAMQSSNTVAFLGFIKTNKEGQVLKDLLIPKLSQYAAIEDKTLDRDSPKVIDVTPSKGEDYGDVVCEDCAKENCEIRGNNDPMPCSDFVPKPQGLNT